jgi:putative nucleotidyltransferase with HDIG domain
MITLEQAEKMVADLEDYAIANGRVKGTWNLYSGHVYNTAKIAKKVADASGLDGDKAYIMGLLHDIGKIDELVTNRYHGLIGFEMLKDEDYDIARICLTHMFPSYKLMPLEEYQGRIFFNNQEDYDFTAKFLRENPPNDYDLLLQLADGLANFDRFVTFEERAIEYRKRHNIVIEDVKLLQKSIASRLKIKEYFDKKIGIDTYKFLGIGE